MKQRQSIKAEFTAKYKKRYPRAVASWEETGDLLFTYFDMIKR